MCSMRACPPNVSATRASTRPTPGTGDCPPAAVAGTAPGLDPAQEANAKTVVGVALSRGLGPTGATLANLLGAAGLSVLVLEKEGGIFPLPRAIHFDGEVLRIVIDDDGPGIPAGQRERVFAPFYRLEREQDHAAAGHGLGLAIAARAVALHGGAIAIDDSPLGGARFTICIRP